MNTYNKIFKISVLDFIKLIKMLINRTIARFEIDYPAPFLTNNHFQKQHNLLENIYSKLKNKEDLDKVLEEVDSSQFGERIVEYSIFHKWLEESDSVCEILDVGCVLNNKIVSDLLYANCSNVWFCNPVVESINQIKNPVFYHISSLAESFPDNRRFPLVTCLSTIEHIGFDNSHYGSSNPAKFDKPSTEPFKESFEKLADLVVSKGRLLISFPYGYREVLINPGTRKISSQVMDYESVQECIPVLENKGMKVNFLVYEAFEKGWKKVDPVNCNARYANGRPGATGVALLDCYKNR